MWPSGKVYIPSADKCAPVIGVVTMNQIVIDITGLPVRVGDTVVLIGSELHGQCENDPASIARVTQQKDLEVTSCMHSASASLTPCPDVGAMPCICLHSTCGG